MNITFALDDALVSAAQAAAARHGTSITAMVSTALEQHVAVDLEVAAGGASGVLQALVGYSIGRLPRTVAMQALGLDDFSALLRLLNAASLAHPVVPVATRKEMAAGMSAAVRAHQQTT